MGEVPQVGGCSVRLYSPAQEQEAIKEFHPHIAKRPRGPLLCGTSRYTSMSLIGDTLLRSDLVGRWVSDCGDGHGDPSFR